MAKSLTVHAYADNMDGKGEGPDQPLMQILASEDGEVKGFVFHPKYAALIAVAILEGADAISRGHRDHFTTTVLMPDEARP